MKSTEAYTSDSSGLHLAASNAAVHAKLSIRIAFAQHASSLLLSDVLWNK